MCLKIRKTEDFISGSVKKKTSAKITFQNYFDLQTIFVCYVTFFVAFYFMLRGLHEYLLMSIITLPDQNNAIILKLE